MADFVLRQRFWRSGYARALVLATPVGLLVAAFAGDSWPVRAAFVGALVVGWALAVRSAQVSTITVTPSSVEVRALFRPPHSVPRSSITAIDAHAGSNGLYSARNRVLELSPSWSPDELARLGHALGVMVCYGPGPNCPSAR